MDITILVFSPSGNTASIGLRLHDKLQQAAIKTSFIDLTRNKDLWVNKNYTQFYATLPAHDLLCIGSPVYAHTVPAQVLDFITQLPRPDSKNGTFALPFVTYGGVSSGMALSDMAHALKESGRTTVCGMKINASHSLSQKSATPINVNMPGPEIEPLLEACVTKLLAFDPEVQIDAGPSLAYQKDYQRPARRSLPPMHISYDQCKLCKKCAAICPVQRIEIRDGAILFNDVTCIHCGECYFNCNNHAILWDKSGIDLFLEKVAENKKPLLEQVPYSALYPL